MPNDALQKEKVYGRERFRKLLDNKKKKKVSIYYKNKK